MDEKDLQDLAMLIMRLHVELTRAQRQIASLTQELEELKKLHNPVAEGN